MRLSDLFVFDEPCLNLYSSQYNPENEMRISKTTSNISTINQLIIIIVIE
jgi:hypothetical protein